MLWLPRSGRSHRNVRDRQIDGNDDFSESCEDAVNACRPDPDFALDRVEGQRLGFPFMVADFEMQIACILLCIVFHSQHIGGLL